MRPTTYAAVERIFTLTAAEKPILMFAATSMREAQSLLREAWMLADLKEARANGEPVWNGNDKIVVRNATQPEGAQYLETKYAIADGSDDLVLVYLIELDGSPSGKKA